MYKKQQILWVIVEKASIILKYGNISTIVWIG